MTYTLQTVNWLRNWVLLLWDCSLVVQGDSESLASRGSTLDQVIYLCVPWIPYIQKQYKEMNDLSFSRL